MRQRGRGAWVMGCAARLAGQRSCQSLLHVGLKLELLGGLLGRSRRPHPPPPTPAPQALYFKRPTTECRNIEDLASGIFINEFLADM